jgi:hypothetical protein
MNKYMTLVVRVPTNAEDRARLDEGYELLRPYLSASSCDDEMTILELIEQHEDFPEHIANRAREQTRALHAQAALADNEHT